jgi:hypothetical protein
LNWFANIVHHIFQCLKKENYVFTEEEPHIEAVAGDPGDGE